MLRSDLRLGAGREKSGEWELGMGFNRPAIKHKELELETLEGCRPYKKLLPLERLRGHGSYHGAGGGGAGMPERRSSPAGVRARAGAFSMKPTARGGGGGALPGR
jgi:hypothetical protein